MLSPQYAGWRAKIGLLFGGLTLLFWISCYFMFPEVSCVIRFHRDANTQCNARIHQELDELYASGVPIRNFAKTKKTAQLAREGRRAVAAEATKLRGVRCTGGTKSGK
jgi:hypothetical protein